MKFLAGPIDIEETTRTKMYCACVSFLLLILFVRYTHFFLSSFSAIFGCVILYCVVVHCTLTGRKIEKKVLKSRICHFSSTSLHFICVRRPRRRVHRFEWRVCEFLLIFLRHADTTIGGLQYTPTRARTNTHSTQWPRNVLCRERREISFSSFSRPTSHTSIVFSISHCSNRYFFVVVLLSSSSTFVALVDMVLYAYARVCVRPLENIWEYFV